MAKAPQNLLIICSDEHRKDAMSCAGHAQVQTPNLDELARRGSRFANAYTPSPMCVPARAAIATGRYVHEIGCWDSASPYMGTPQSWMHSLRDAGHETVSIGKLHFRSGDDDNGFSREILPMHVVGGVGWTIGLLRETLPKFDTAHELAAEVGAGSSSYTDYDLEITTAAENWLKHEATALDKPWAAFVSLVSPHYPLTCPQPFYDLYRPEDVNLPVGWREATVEHEELSRIAGFFDYDRHFNEETLRQALCAYFGLVSFMDACVGRVIAALSASGQMNTTTVVYMSDHGEMLGDHGLWTKQVMYEASAGVPLIVAGAEIPAGKTVTTPVSLLDIAPTALDVMRVSGRSNLSGASLIEIAKAEDRMDRTVFSEYHDGGSTTASFMTRWGAWKYVHYVGCAPQLFNLESDPEECNDLAARADRDPEIAVVLIEGEARLRAICDPDAVNCAAFAAQKAKIADLGGEDACRTAYSFNHTPAPTH